MNNLGLKKQHISTQVYLNYERYARANHPSVDVRALVRECGLDGDYLDDHSGWVSTSFDRQFMKRLEEEASDSELAFKVGAFAVSRDGLKLGLYYAMTLLASTKSVYTLIPKFAANLNKVIALEVIDSAPGRLSLSITPRLEGLDETDIRSLVESFPHVIANTRGYLSAVPTLFGDLPADVELLSMSTPGEPPLCVVGVRYNQHNGLLYSLSYVTALLVGVVCALHLGVEGWSAVDAVLICFPILCLIVFRQWQKLDKFKFHVSENQETVHALQKMYAGAHSAKESLDRSLREQSVINSLLARLLETRTDVEVIEESCRIVVDEFSFDRAMVLGVNEAAGVLEFRYGHSIVSDSLDFFRSAKFPLEIDSSDPNKISNVYRFRKSLLIPDCAAHLRTLTVEGRSFLEAAGSLSFIAAPIVADSRCLGIFVIDAFRSKRMLDPRDLAFAEKIANAVAASWSKLELVAARERALVRSNHLKDQILANTTHELKTPLHGILGLVQILKGTASGKLDQKENEFLGTIESSANRLSRLVNDILDMSRINAEKMEVELSDVELESAVDATIGLFRELGVRKGVEVRKGSFPRGLKVRADENRLQQVLVNIVGNSLKFTDSGFVEIAAKLGAVDVQVLVSDSGRGIAADQWEKVFEEFKQADDVTAQGIGGTGLGLSIARGLIEAHGGKIWIQESAPGRGTTMAFTLRFATLALLSGAASPARAGPATNAVSSARAVEAVLPETGGSGRESSAKPNDGSGIDILIVDDEPVNITVLANQLEGAGFRVRTALDGRAALSDLELNGVPDLILLDVMMPGMNGMEVCKHVRRSHEHSILPVIFLTAKQLPEDVIAGFNAGGNDYISKPFIREVLIARVRSHLTSASALRQSNRFVPWELIRLLGVKNIDEVKIGMGAEVERAIFFLDIRRFTTLLEDMAGTDALRFLNSFLGQIAPVVMRHRGVVDKYIGDCIMGVFESADDAITAALEAHVAIASYNEKHRSGGRRTFVHSGIGIHWGKVSVGAVGVNDRLDVTVISDTVNTAARVQEYTKKLDAPIVVSRELLGHCTSSVASKAIPRGVVSLRGRLQEVELFEIPLESTAEESDSKDVIKTSA